MHASCSYTCPHDHDSWQLISAGAAGELVGLCSCALVEHTRIVQEVYGCIVVVLQPASRESLVISSIDSANIDPAPDLLSGCSHPHSLSGRIQPHLNSMYALKPLPWQILLSSPSQRLARLQGTEYRQGSRSATTLNSTARCLQEFSKSVAGWQLGKGLAKRGGSGLVHAWPSWPAVAMLPMSSSPGCRASMRMAAGPPPP